MINVKVKHYKFRGKKIIWITSLILDVHLSKTSRLEILEHLTKRGHSAYLIATQTKRKFNLKHSNIHLIPIPLRYLSVISTMFFGIIITFILPFYIIYVKPDFIITDPFTPVFAFIWKPILSRLMKFKVILDIRSIPVETSGFRFGYLRNLNFKISIYIANKIFNGMTIITSEMKKEICKNFDIDIKSVGILSDAVSDELFTYEKNAIYGLELKRKFGLSNRFIVFYHGVFGKNRGLIESVNAMSIIKEEYPHIALFLLGNGSALPILKDTIRKNRLEDRVIIQDAVDYTEVPKYIAMCDIGIVPLPNIPDWRPQCPLKLLEYLSMKKVVIITDIPANRNIVQDKKCGIYISSTNPVEIAKSIIFAYNNKEKLEEWGVSGREIISRKYNWKKVTEDLESYLLSCR